MLSGSGVKMMLKIIFEVGEQYLFLETFFFPLPELPIQHPTEFSKKCLGSILA